MPLAVAAPVEFFTKSLWETSLPSQWREALLNLDEDQLLRYVHWIFEHVCKNVAFICGQAHV